jgi:hypothetical protein
MAFTSNKPKHSNIRTSLGIFLFVCLSLTFHHAHVVCLAVLITNKRENDLFFTILPTRDLTRCCQWFVAIMLMVSKDYQRDLQAERILDIS